MSSQIEQETLEVTFLLSCKTFTSRKGSQNPESKMDAWEKSFQTVNALSYERGKGNILCE